MWRVILSIIYFKEPTLSRFVTKEQHSNSTQDIINNEKDRTAASNIPLNGISYNDEISLSLQDELEVGNIADEKLESERKKELACFLFSSVQIQLLNFG